MCPTERHIVRLEKSTKNISIFQILLIMWSIADNSVVSRHIDKRLELVIFNYIVLAWIKSFS